MVVNKSVRFSLLISSILLSLVIVEYTLMSFGAKPGVYLFFSEIKQVDSLILYQNFDMDEFGIYKFSPWVSDSFPKYFNHSTGLLENTNVMQALAENDRFDLVYSDFAQITNPQCCSSMEINIHNWFYDNKGKSNLRSVFDSLSNQSNLDIWGQRILEYVHHPINKDGFRSIPFRNDTTERQKILIIGDSYVYGMTASPFHASYTDNLLAKGYMVYAAGIPGSDPAQYAAIAQKYIPLIKPDLVIMCFYEGNDYLLYDRKCSPSTPPEYLTNAGFFQSSPYGKFMSLEECYKYYKTLILIPNQSSNFVNKIMSKTIVTSLIWGALYKLGLMKHPFVLESEKKMNAMQNNANAEFTACHIRDFDTACRLNNTPVIYTVIPNRDDDRFPNTEYTTFDSLKAVSIFENKHFLQPYGLIRKKHYWQNDTHFNTSGAYFFTQFLENCIQSHFANMDTTFAKK